MSKYDEKAAKALQEAKRDCDHRPDSRAVDLDSGDDWCGDCGTVIRTYVPGTPNRFPGRLASDLIVAQLKEELPGQMVQTRLFYVEPVGKNEFNAYMQVHLSSGTEHRYYRLFRTSTDDSAVTVTRRAS